MSRRLRLVLGLCVAIAAPATLATSALADGLPLPFDSEPGAGVTSLDGASRYATVTAGNSTVAIWIDPDGGEIERTLRLDGAFGVPLVAYDATASGLSADGRTLALIRPRTSFPREETTFAILDAERLRLREELTLPGDFSFDALSPDGRTLYLIEYPEPRDATAYEVRAYDLEAGRLLPDPIVDPNESQEEMAGFPQTRAVSPDGRWAYTLYARARANEPPFVHALDTEGRTAVCIDLDAVAPRTVQRLQLVPSADGSELAVHDGETPVASIDLETFEVSDPQALAPTDASEKEGPEALPWLALGGGVGLSALAILGLGRRRREPAP